MPIKKHSCNGYKGNMEGAKFQNERYGVGNRVCSTNAKGDFICSVCGEIIKNESGFVSKKLGAKK